VLLYPVQELGGFSHRATIMRPNQAINGNLPN
jgi:hypothetical protein